MSVFTPRRIERGDSCLPLPVHGDPDDLSIPSSAKSVSPESDPPSTRSLRDEAKSEIDGTMFPLRRHSDYTLSPRMSRAVSIDPKLNILDMSADEIAEQQTLIDLELLRKIHLVEFERCRWTKKEKSTLSPNIVRFLQRFNHTSFWVVRDILNEAAAKNRAELIMQFIKITRRLVELNNLHSLVAMVAALDSMPIQRLTNTWKHVSRRDRSTLDKLSELISNEDNYARLRARMDPLQLPCIPHLGLYLRDLVYLDALSSTSGDFQQKIGDIMSVITTCQQSVYHKLSVVPVIQRYLRSERYIEELQKFYEDDNYKLSLLREPDPSLAQAMNTPRAAPCDLYIHPPRISKSQENLITPLKPVSAGPKHLVTTPPKTLSKTRFSAESGLPSEMSTLQAYSNGGSRDVSPVMKRATLPATTRMSTDLKGTLSLSTVTGKSHVNSPRLSKKKKGHRKSMSVGSNVLTVLGVNPKPEGRVPTPEVPSLPVSLLDDSLLDNCVTKSSTVSTEYYPTYTPPLSTTSSADVNSGDEESEVFLPGEEVEDEDHISCEEGDHILKEGKLKRKVLRRRGSSVAINFTTSHRVQLTPISLLYTKNQGKKMKEISLDDIKIHYHEPSFQLSDKQFVVVDKKGTQLKFTAPSASEAESWAESIRNAGEQLAQRKAEEKPLIKL